MTRTSSKCPPVQLPGPQNASLSHSASQLYDAQHFDDVAADADTPIQTYAERDNETPPEDCHCRPEDSASRSSSPPRSVGQSPSVCDDDDDEHRLAVSSDNMNIGLRRRIVDGCAAAAEHFVADVADQKHQLQVQASRQTPMSSVDSETGVRNTRRSKQKVSLL